MLNSLLIIVGPTAIGKTSLAIEIAKRIPAEIISGDSMQVYRLMDIGTAKARIEEQQGIPHHMIDILNPDQEYSVALFQSMVEKLITKINEKGKLPILVGGTGLYIRSIIDHYDFTESSVDWDFRNKMKAEAGLHGNEYLHHKLSLIDPAAATKIHPNDLKRIIRALEVYHHTGKPISEFQYRDEYSQPKYNMLMYGLNMERDKLYDVINSRVDEMIHKGLVEEIKVLLAKGFQPSLTSLQAIGYKEIIDYLTDKHSLAEAIDILKQNTRRFAKRQLTWFRRDKRIRWFNVEGKDSILGIADEIGKEVCRTILKHVE